MYIQIPISVEVKSANASIGEWLSSSETRTPMATCFPSPSRRNIVPANLRFRSHFQKYGRYAWLKLRSAVESSIYESKFLGTVS
jgi:hypothetical protein